MPNGHHRTRLKLPYLRAWRTRRVMTQAELAYKAGTDKTTIIRLESGRQFAIVSTIGKLAEALGVSREDLVYKNPDEDERDQAAKLKGAA